MRELRNFGPRGSGHNLRSKWRSSTELVANRTVSSGSVFSTILIASVIAEAAPVGRFDRLIDVGSGDSPYRDVIDHTCYVGVDRCPRGDEALLVTGDATSLPVASGSADAVLCTEVIEHVADERALAAELTRIAGPGGTLLLSSPFVHGLHEQPYDFRRLTSIGLVTTLEQAGWQVDTFASVGGALVVCVDGLIRWADSWWRRIVRGLLPARLSQRLIAGPSAAAQRVLAAVVLKQSNNLGLSDPMSPHPRLTLGYVVRAHRADRLRDVAT